MGSAYKMERMTWTEPSGSRLEMRPFVTASDRALGRLIVPPSAGASAECYKREENAAGERRLGRRVPMGRVRSRRCSQFQRADSIGCAAQGSQANMTGRLKRPVGAS